MKVKEQVDYFFDLKYDEEEEGEGEEDESKIDTLKEIVDWITGANGETIGDLSKEIKFLTCSCPKGSFISCKQIVTDRHFY